MQDDPTPSPAAMVALGLLNARPVAPAAAGASAAPTITEILARCPHPQPTARRGSYLDHARQFPELAD